MDMQKRSEATKNEKNFFRTKLKHTAIVVLCIMFALSTIYAVDIATYKLVENDKDQYAMRIVKQSGDMLRVDVAGNRYDVDLKNIKSYLSRVTEKTKGFITDIKNRLN